MVFRFRGKGKALAAEVTIIAALEKTAHKVALKWASENGLDGSTFRLISKEPFTASGQVVYAWDGDY